MVELSHWELHSLIWLTLRGVEYTLPHEEYGIDGSCWWDTDSHQYTKAVYRVSVRAPGALIVEVRCFRLEDCSLFERKFVFTEERVNGIVMPMGRNDMDGFLKKIPEFAATDWDYYHGCLRTSDIFSLFLLDPWYTMDAKVASCMETLEKIKRKREKVPNLRPWRGIQGRQEAKE